jgi:hypothetical protein
MTAKLWRSDVLSPLLEQDGFIVVAAETREEAIAKANAELRSDHTTADMRQLDTRRQFVQDLLENLEARMTEFERDAIIQWPSEGPSR